MRTGMMMSIAGVIIWTAVTSAQIAPQPQQPTPGSPRQDPAVTLPAPAAPKITLQGCVERQGVVTGTAGAIGTSGSAGSFILTKAERRPSAGAAPSQPAPASNAMGEMTYRLDADSAKLTPHVGHKVELTGTLEASSPVRPQIGSTQPPAPGSANAPAPAPTFKVDEVKMLAASCTQ